MKGILNNQTKTKEDEKFQNNKKSKYIIRDKNNFENKFNELKLQKIVDLTKLEELIKDDDTNPKFIDFYLERIQANHKELFIEKLVSLFPMMPKEMCQKYNINKILSEKDKFFLLYKDIYEAVDSEQLKNIILTEFEFPKEFQNLKISEEEKKKTLYKNRWNRFGNKLLDFQQINNEEYFYYSIMNCIVNSLKENSVFEDRYHLSLIELYDILNKFIKKTKNDIINYNKLFEYIYLFIINAEINPAIQQRNNIDLYKIFLKAIKNEINSIKTLADKQIIERFTSYGKNVEIKDNDIIIYQEQKKIIINDYKNYYITENFIKEASDIKKTNDTILLNYLNFGTLINPKYYFKGKLYQLITSYVSSELSKSSIYNCFNIKEGECPELENEIFTKNIHKYIRYIPYNSYNDTGRTLKHFALIIINPSKQKMLIGQKDMKYIQKNHILLNNLELFINIVTRKHIFEHEHHHLCNNLLFFFYANKSNKINTPPKIIKDDKVLEIDELTLNKDANTDNTDNIMDESGYIFETLAYGRKRNLFNLKQLLFIGNEKNDNLNIYQYKEKFKNLKRDPKEENGVNIESLFLAYDENNILGPLVKTIYSEFKKIFGSDLSIKLNNLAVSKRDSRSDSEEENNDEEDKDSENDNEVNEYKKNNIRDSSDTNGENNCKNNKENRNLKKEEESDEDKNLLFDRFAENFIIEDYDHYDCHIKGTYFCNQKEYEGD